MTTRKFVRRNGLKIGEVSFSLGEGWASVSYACIEKSGGLQGHDGLDNEAEARADVLEMDDYYGPWLPKGTKKVMLTALDRKLLHELLDLSYLNCRSLLGKRRQTKEARFYAEEQQRKIELVRKSLRKFVD